MQLFKNESLRDTGAVGHDLAFGVPMFGPRYARRPFEPRAFALSSAGLHGDDVDDVVVNVTSQPVYPPLHLGRF
ncbi:MAG TPA: hypothetical protein VIT90_17755 [Lysobacter sp.]